MEKERDKEVSDDEAEEKEEKQTLRRRGTDSNPQHIKWPCNSTLQMGSPWACR